MFACSIIIHCLHRLRYCRSAVSDGRGMAPDLLSLSPVPNLDITLQSGEHKIILITDHVASPADFILHRVLSQSLKSSSPGTGSESGLVHTTVISLEREFAQWSAID